MRILRNGALLGPVLIIIAIAAASTVLNQLPHGKAQRIQSNSCLADQPLVREGGVPCTMTEQKNGWPIVANATYTDIKPLAATDYLPSKKYVCYSACSRWQWNWNELILVGVAAAGYVTVRLWVNHRNDRELAYQRKNGIG